MKRILLACSLILVLALALALQSSPATAAKGAWEIGLLGGVGVPMADFKDSLDAKSGPQGGLEVCYHANENVAVGVSLG